MENNFRKLTATEISTLQNRACRCGDWSLIEVAEGFDAESIYNCRFAGRVCIGKNVYIANVHGVVQNYWIGDGVFIENVGEIVCSGSSRFGNGVMVAAVNEGGGREVPIFEGITSQQAYIIAMYRQSKELTAKLYQMVERWSSGRESAMGEIGCEARITGCRRIENVRIGEGAIVQGAGVLSNGTILSTTQTPTRIGADVKIYDFIVARGAVLDNGAILVRCYVGESCVVDSGFTAADSLFFANSYCANGEACSIFAGPYTVSHHKSSLLIAGYFSFFNAGSGTNLSNHLFKKGPVHQAVNERGCKFASNGYIMAPAKTGAFSVILGRHASHHNTEFFPFSYLTESEGKSYLIPGMNLRSFGMVRDVAKWPARDNRTTSKTDLIHFEQYNPYIGERVERAIAISENLLSNNQIDTYNYERVRIKQTMLKRGLSLYRMAMNSTIGAILESGCDGQADGSGHWVDLGGMYAPKSAVTALLERIESGECCSVGDFEAELRKIYNSYCSYAYNWAIGALERRVGHSATSENIAAAITQGQNDRAALKQITDDDGVKDLGPSMMVGYGIDASEPTEIEADFNAVHK